MAAVHFATNTFELHIKSFLGVGGEIRPCNSNIAYPRFEVYKTFLCVFISNFMVFMRYQLWVNVPVAIFLGIRWMYASLFSSSPYPKSP